jgi:hypothetical protein
MTKSKVIRGPSGYLQMKKLHDIKCSYNLIERGGLFYVKIPNYNKSLAVAVTVYILPC